jgi:hypothetical protein
VQFGTLVPASQGELPWKLERLISLKHWCLCTLLDDMRSHKTIIVLFTLRLLVCMVRSMNVAPCGLVDMCHCFRGTCCFHLQEKIRYMKGRARMGLRVNHWDLSIK